MFIKKMYLQYNLIILKCKYFQSECIKMNEQQYQKEVMDELKQQQENAK